MLVYDTCTPQNVEGCSLYGSSCGINQSKLTFQKAFEEQKLDKYITQPFTSFGTIISLIPDRLKNWEAKEYLAQNPSYYYQFDSTKKLQQRR